MGRRVAAVLLVFVASALVSQPLMAGLYARGIALTLGPVGALAHAPAIAVLVALLAVIFARVRRIERARAGLVIERSDVLAMLAAMTLTTAWLTGFVAACSALVGAPLARSGNAFSVSALALAALSFVGSSLIQQLQMQSAVVAAAPDTGVTRGAIAVGTLIFTLAHAMVSSAPLYLANVALFGLSTALLFSGTKRPSYGLALGLHAGWNFTQVAVLGAPFGGSRSATALFRWPDAAPTLFGGANGFDEGALFTLALLPFTLFALARRRAMLASAPAA